MGLFLTVVGLLLVVYAILKLYTKLTTGWCKSATCLVGKTTIITGANTGIGYETALDFAKRGAKVILACRDQQKAEDARTRIIEETGNTNVVVKMVDMASFDSVRAFAEDINKNEDRLDILVNNAGVFEIHNKRSKDGHDLLMQINHFSCFLLTNLLIVLLKKSRISRIINVSSAGAWRAKYFDLDKLDQYADHDKYPDSKLCNILFTVELARKLEGTGVTTYSLHPGLVSTEIFKHTQGIKKRAIALALNLFGKTSEEGAQTTIYCSLEKGIERYSGDHFADCKRVSPYATVTAATVQGLPKKLWKLSEEIVQLKPQEKQC